ncbi:hypothetical protein ACPPVQ_17060 [Diaminobutyricibacter sp. McL0618]|uniref:hypothetical protein n=1 Tax=Leifsonia sp. McL0618 TaxID=3415677 RepID=UPI003CEA2B9C
MKLNMTAAGFIGAVALTLLPAVSATAAISATTKTCSGTRTSDFCDQTRNSAGSQRAVMTIKLTGGGNQYWQISSGGIAGKILCSGSVPANGVAQTVGCNVPAGTIGFRVKNFPGTQTASLNS